MQNARGEGVGREYACVNRELLFKHGNKAQPASGSFCSLNELTMGKLGHCCLLEQRQLHMSHKGCAHTCFSAAIFVHMPDRRSYVKSALDRPVRARHQSHCCCSSIEHVLHIFGTSLQGVHQSVYARRFSCCPWCSFSTAKRVCKCQHH